MYDNSPLEINYVAPPTLNKLHMSDAFVRGVRGPIGSGKTVGLCVGEVYRRCAEQAKGKDGYRRSRWAIIRNTYPELETTTIKTWLDWFPEEIFGKFSRRVPMCHFVDFNDIKAEIYFLALDRPDDVKKLLSLELTGAMINEARESPIEIVQTVCDRVGRYPSQRDRPAHIERDDWPTWYGVVMDTNSPDDDHWWPMMAGDAELPDDWTVPENWEFFTQPPAAWEEKRGARSVWVLNPKAENLENLPKDYYKNLIMGKPNSHVRVYVGNQYGTPVEGRIVYPEYSDDLHLSEEPIKAVPGKKIHVGLDFGMTPAALWGQYDSRGQYRDLHELATEGVGPKTFARLLKADIAQYFPGLSIMRDFEWWGDPSGAFPSGGADFTYFEILHAAGIPVRAAPTQDPDMRIEAGREPLLGVLPGGVAAYQLSPTCKMMKKAYKNGYRHARIKASGSVRYHPSPEKNKYSHLMEAGQYAKCGAGFAKQATKGDQKWGKRPIKAKINFQGLR